ncbi:MAG: Acetate operon repressor [Lentisphaerae bacterium ADurb.Bin242]|nr:MAG: Acetate operon repressor [Lentisphaerae bacterium ADurb.Bin242]
MAAVQSVERAFQILEMLYENKNPDDGLGIASVSRELGLKLPTVHNLMKTLVLLGYAEQKEDGKYRPGPKADKFGMKSDSRLLALARPLIARLVRELNETAVLIVAHDGVRYTLFQEECTRELKVSADTFPNSNFCGTATGLAILSRFSESRLKQYLDSSPDALTGYFNSTAELKKTLRKIRKDGCCVLEKEEFVVFGVPVSDPGSGLYAALGMFVPLTRYDRRVRAEISAGMKAAAEALLLCIKQ